MTTATTTTNELFALFAEADRIGNKYQSQEEIEDYGARLDAAFEAVEDTIAHQTITQVITPLKFSSLATAKSFADKAVKTMAVMLGDDSKFWVVSMAESQRLERAGYEWA